MLLLFACAPPDTDGDGVPDAQDCAPADAAVFPGAVEACDGVDQDCDGALDDDLPTSLRYLDGDGDGHGAEAGAYAACGEPAGTTASGGDCDDADATTFPGAPEQCDGQDHDCDGRVLEADAADAAPWFLDGDADGWGGAAGETACLLPTGHAGNDLDCDDADAAHHPGAAESCTAGDLDCDGLVGDADPDAVATAVWYVDADGDGEGDAARAIEGWDCTPDGGYSLEGTDCDDADRDRRTRDWGLDADGDGYGDPATLVRSCEDVAGHVPDARDCDDGSDAVNPGVYDDCGDGVDADCNGLDCFLPLLAADKSLVGDQVGAQGDLDGDGVIDLANGAPSAGNGTGGVQVYAGPIGPGMAPVATVGPPPGQPFFGSEVEIADLDQDGVGDLLVRGDVPAAVYVLPGPVETQSTSDRTPSWQVYGTTSPYTGEGTMWSSDLDGDARPDLVLSSWDTYTSPGVYVLPAGIPDPGTPVASVATAHIEASTNRNIGWSADGHADLDGDGVNDLVLGAGLDIASQYLCYALLFRGPIEGELVAGDADVTVNGYTDTDLAFGLAVRALGDVTGDGLPEWSVQGMDDVFLYSGLEDGQVRRRDYTTRLRGVSDFYAGYLPVVAAQLDGEGGLDLAYGAPHALDGRGTLYVAYSPLPDSVTEGDGSWAGELGYTALATDLAALPGGEGLVVSSAWAGDHAALHFLSAGLLP